MKKLLIVSSLLILAVIGVTRLSFFKGPTQSSNFFTQPNLTSAFNLPSPTPQASEPVTLTIPKLNVTAKIEKVGQDSYGRMDVPKDFHNVAWYSLGFKPGDKGSAVIDGHFDTVTGAPAVFYDLTKLNPGDEVVVTNQSNQQLHFKVISQQTYDYDKVPMQQIFADIGTSKLNLITCGGTWDKQSKNYSKRTVIYSVLES